MKRQSLLFSAALLCGMGAMAQAAGTTTALLPAGVTANITQTKHVVEQKNLCVAGSPTKGYYAFFSATDADHGEELWITDGTPEGTRMVKDINPGTATSDIQYITRFNDKVVFSATDGENGYELWISDGTEDGTYMVSDIHTLDSSNPTGFTQLDENHMVFFAMDMDSETYDADPQMWLWITDGTEDGTKLVKELDAKYPGSENGDHRWGATMRVGRKVFFKADVADKSGTTYGEELWVTDGTADGTHMVKDVNTEANANKEGSTNGAAITHMQNFYNEKVFFKGWSLKSGNEPWASDGTEEGTYEIFDVYPVVNAAGVGEGCNPCMIGEPWNGNIFFRGRTQERGHELCWTNLEKGDMHYWDINTNEPTQDKSSHPDPGVSFDGYYMFCANSGTDAALPNNYGGEIFCCDGEKVFLQKDYAPGATNCNWVKEMIVVGGSLYWWNEGSLDGTTATNTKLNRLDKWDGTPEIVSNIDANGDKVYGLRNLNGDLLFTSAVNNQVYVHHYRQEGYDPTKNPDVMEPEYRTRKEIADDNSSVINIGSDLDLNAPAEYFNLQGVRVANPDCGVYIVRQGNKVSKIVK